MQARIGHTVIMVTICFYLFNMYVLFIFIHIDGNASKPHISIFDENEFFCGNMFLIPISIKCQWLVLKFECKVYQNGRYRSSKHYVSSLF